MGPKKPQAQTSFLYSSPFWNQIFGILACLFVFITPFFQDEKLVRLKLEAFEIGLLILILAVGLKIILSGQG